MHTFLCAIPFSFGKTKLSQRLFVLFCSFSTQKYFLLFDCQRSCGLALQVLVGLDGLEPSTSRLSGARSSHLSYKPELTHRLYDSFICCQLLLAGGDEGNRTLDPLLAGQVLSQLSYTPI